MFSKTTFVFALVALFAVQSSSAQQVERVNERALDDLIEKANEAIQKLIDIVNSSVQSAIAKLEEVKDKVIAQGQEIISEVEKKINGIVYDVSVEISKILDKTGMLSDEAKACVDANLTNLEKLPQVIMDNLHQCVNDQLDEANNIIGEAKQIILSVNDELASLPEKLKECKTSFTCILKLSAQVAKDMSSIPLEIASTVAKTMKFMATVQVELNACTVKNMLVATKEAATIVVKVGECVANKS